MLYLDYNWDLYNDRIVLDSEINTKKLGWEDGDYFKIVTKNGTTQIVKVDPIEIFIKGEKVNGA